MTITKYRDIVTGAEFFSLPKIHNNKSPITEANFQLAGLEAFTVEIPDPAPPVIPAELVAKERQFAKAIFDTAVANSIDLTAIELNITGLLTAAEQAGISQADLLAIQTKLLTIKCDIEAETNLPWGECWANLKSRLPGYFQEFAV